MEEITAGELKKRMEAGEDLLLIDVREPREHEEFNIGGMLLPLGQIRNQDIDEVEYLMEQEVILYCRSGNRSGQACQILDSMGFSRTRNLKGGMLAWQEQFGQTK